MRTYDMGGADLQSSLSNLVSNKNKVKVYESIFFFFALLFYPYRILTGLSCNMGLLLI